MKNYTMIKNGKTIRFCAECDADARIIAAGAKLVAGHVFDVVAEDPAPPLFTVTCSRQNDPARLLLKLRKVIPQENYRGLADLKNSLRYGQFWGYPEKVAIEIWNVLYNYACSPGMVRVRS